jgi:hypothetical protein
LSDGNNYSLLFSMDCMSFSKVLYLKKSAKLTRIEQVL